MSVLTQLAAAVTDGSIEARPHELQELPIRSAARSDSSARVPAVVES